MAINLQKFISAASRMPAVAQQILNALDYDLRETDYKCAIAMLADDVQDDPDHHGITAEELQDFLEEVDHEQI